MQVAMPEYMKVRAHLYKLIMNSDGKSLQITPENELCRLFDVSRVTVRRAIKGLSDDGFLITRRGLGTFINPERISCKKLIMPIIGIIKGHGNHVTNIYDTGILESLIQTGLHYETVYLPNSGKPETFLEIVRNSLSGIIWDGATVDSSLKKYIKALCETGMPLLRVEEAEPSESNDYILSTPFGRGKIIADYMFSRGHKKVLFIHNDDSAKEHYASSSTYSGYCQRMTELCGDEWGSIKNNIVFCLDLERKLKEKSEFTAVYSGNYLVPYTMDRLLSTGISVPNDMSYLTYEKSSPFFFDGLQPDFIDRKRPLMDAIFKWLKKRIIDKDLSGTFREIIEVKAVQGETVKVLNEAKICSK